MSFSTSGGLQFKLVLIGDGGVGKTSIRHRYLGKAFKSTYIPTIGVDFAQKFIEYKDVPVRLVIWDLAGQSMFKNVRRHYYQGASGLILVYSVVHRETFDNITKWLVEAYEHMRKLPPIIVVGNKTDLRVSHPVEHQIATEEGTRFTEYYMQKLNRPAVFMETSALTGEKIIEAFEELTNLMIDFHTKK